jgi:hypothetical protein
VPTATPGQGKLRETEKEREECRERNIYVNKQGMKGRNVGRERHEEEEMKTKRKKKTSVKKKDK